MSVTAHSESSAHTSFQFRLDNIRDWKVLIVDDVTDNTTVLSTILKLKKAQVETASSGAEAIEKLASFRPNLLLLDLAMPDMDGWQVKKFLDNHSDFAHIPVIAVSAFQSSRVQEKLQQAGFAGLIAKPFAVAMIPDQICQIAQA